MARVNISPRTRKILEELAERIIPSGGPGYPGSQEVALVDRLLERMAVNKLAVLGLKIVAWSWELSPILLFRFKLFTKMGPDEQTRYLEGWENSRFMLRRYALFGLKAIFLASFYLQPQVWSKIGYEPGKCFAQSEKGGEN